MRKQLLTCLILLLSVAAMAQQKMTINLVKSDSYVRVTMNGADVLKVYNGTFQQKYSTLRSDSAYVYVANNTFDAFGHVVITQGDTLHVYSDKLNYNDNTKIAILTDHVKMVDKDATLTTNNFNYNTATKYGTYINGGKLVNKDNTLVSKNGYYFANSRDAYFRYDVVMTSPDALIKTDTLRYNSGSRITYFYGPTHIYGKKDKDTLYTENGTYNTKTEQAFFGKKNRYSQGTKSLKGDSLFYDKLKGYGRAIKNITFEDTEQKMTIKGNLGEYYKADDKAVVTQGPYVIFVTEEKDTTKVDTVKNIAAVPGKKDSLRTLTKAGQTLAAKAKDAPTLTIPKNTPTGKADSLAKAVANMPAVKNTMPLVNSVLKDTSKKPPAIAAPPKSAQAKSPTTPPGKDTKLVAKNGKVATDTIHAKPLLAKADTAKRLKRDTMYIGADTLETQIVTYKYLKDLQEQRRLAGIRDTSVKPRKPFVPYTAKTMPKFLVKEMPAMYLDTPNFKGRPLFAVKKTSVDTTKKKPVVKKPDLTPDAKKKVLADADLKKLKADSLLKAAEKPKLSDTSRVRILSAHHNVHIFKSDLQGKSDSLFYSSADSVIRSFVKPMYWTQGAQLSGDTIYLHLKNNKAEHMDVYPAAFVVYLENSDSTHFNQVGGKRLRAYFKDSKLNRAVVTGNGETIYFNRKKGKVTEMQRSLSSYITLNMKNGEAANVSLVGDPDQKAYPINKVKEDDKILKGFIWKPKDRPRSKEDVIHPKKPVAEEKAGKGPSGKTPTKAIAPAKAQADGKGTSKVTLPPDKGAGTLKGDTVNIKKDSLTVKKDTTLIKKAIPPAKKDSVKH